MVELKVYLSDSLNEKFRRLAMTVFGYGRGSLSKAAEEAFTKWCLERENAGGTATIGDSSSNSQTRINPDERTTDGKASASTDGAHPESQRTG